MTHIKYEMDSETKVVMTVRALHEAAETEARGIAGRVRRTSGNVAQRKSFADAGTTAA